MKNVILFLFLFLTIVSSPLFSQAKIPESIAKDLILRPSPKPYESTGFSLEKGVTLTILPGTVINFSQDTARKGFIEINGTLNIGDKGAAGSKPVKFEGAIGEIHFKDAKIDINGWEPALTRYQFHGDNSGTIRNSKLLRCEKTIPYSLYIQVPKKDSLVFTNCLIEDQDVEIITTDFPNDLSRLSFTGCAFTFRVVADKGYYYKIHTLPTLIFAYGTKCDSYIAVEFKAFNWELKKPIITEWYIDDENIKKTLDGSAKTLKTFSLKLVNKKFTKFVQAPKPEVKDEKKK